MSNSAQSKVFQPKPQANEDEPQKNKAQTIDMKNKNEL